MCCPHFYPLAQRFPAAAPTAIFPLGDFWTGACHAIPAQACEPEEALLRPLCQFGYARGQCGRFSIDDPGPDAVRFTVSADTGDILRLYYVLERDHHPFAHGPLEYSLSARRFAAAPSGETLHRQAQAYVESYLRRKPAAPAH